MLLFKLNVFRNPFLLTEWKISTCKHEYLQVQEKLILV